MYADGGGKAKAVLNPIYGREKLVRFFERVWRNPAVGSAQLVHEGTIDGLPAYVTMDPDGMVQTTAFAIEDGRIVALYVTRNPDKLKGIRRAVVGESS